MADAARPPRRSGWSWRRPTRPASSTWRAFEALLSPRTRLVAVTHISNVTGALVADRDASSSWRIRRGAKVLVDGCQAVPRMPVDVRALGCDFYAFSGHKAYGPTGTGVLYGRYDAAVGDAAVADRRRDDPQRHLDKTEFQEPPHRFEAGTPDIAGAVGLGPAIDFIEEIGRDGDPRARGGADRLRRRPAVAHSRACSWSAAGSGGSASSPSISTACTRTMSAPCSTSIMWRCASATTAPSR